MTKWPVASKSRSVSTTYASVVATIIGLSSIKFKFGLLYLDHTQPFLLVLE
jgi:hypothetical protein